MTKPSTGHNIIGMDGLRGIAAVTVVMVHATHILAPGVQYSTATSAILALASQGLTLFFALSGFLLFRPFALAIIGSRPFPNIKRFFGNRALRIYPAYIVILLAVGLVMGAAYVSAMGPSDGLIQESERVGRLTNPLLLALNATMLGSLFPPAMQTGLSVSWTLTVELIFYVAMPLLALGALVLSRRTRRSVAAAFLPAVVVLVLGLLGKVALTATLESKSVAESTLLQWGDNWTAVFARSFLVHSDLFAFGMVAAVIVALCQTERVSLRWIQKARWIGLLAGSIILIGTNDTAFANTGWAGAFAAVILFVAAPTLRGSASPLAHVLQMLPFRFVGVVSYSLYLWHLPVIWTLYKTELRFGLTELGFWLNLVLVLAIGLALSTLTYEFIEKQALRLKKTTVISNPAVTVAR
jgi:peptidoglycan/LPS O-acetylase OafA/YrhL